MCLANPAKILEIDGDDAVVDYGGLRKKVNIQLVDTEVGGWVLIHAGFAIQKISEQHARETLAIYAEMGRLEEEVKKTARVASSNSAEAESLDEAADRVLEE